MPELKLFDCFRIIERNFSLAAIEDTTSLFLFYIIIIVSTIGSLQMIFALQGYRFSLKSFLFLCIPPMLIVTLSIYQFTLPNFFNSSAELMMKIGDYIPEGYFADLTMRIEDHLPQGYEGYMPLFQQRELYVETLFFSLIFMVLLTIYAIFYFKRIINPKSHSRISAIVLSYGQATILALLLFLFSAINIVNTEVSNFEARMFLYAYGVIIFKMVEILFVWVYVSLVGLRKLRLIKIKTDLPNRGGRKALCKIIRKQCGVFPLIFLLFTLPFLISSYEIIVNDYLQVILNAFDTGFVLGIIFALPFLIFPFFFWLMVRRAFYFTFPRLHSVFRRINSLYAPYFDEYTRLLLTEAAQPQYIEKNYCVTEHFIIDENSFIPRIYDCSDMHKLNDKVKAVVHNSNIKLQPFKSQRMEKFIELASVLSDNDRKFLDIIMLYVEGKDEFWDKFLPMLEDADLDVSEGFDLDIDEVIKYGLICFGYMGYNDWNFPLKDLLFNSTRAFKHYGIDMSIYDDIPNQNELCAPDALKLMETRLPDGFGLGMWDFEEDSYVLIVSRKSILERAEKLGTELYLPIYSSCSRKPSL